MAVITADDEDGIDLMRHDCAHVLAEAVQELFPNTQVTIGPVIENGFYYDFARETPFSLDDLEAIEKRMKEIVDRNEEIVREEWEREAVAHFREIGEEYKAEIIAAIPADQAITVYRQGAGKICAVARICRLPASWQSLQADQAGRCLLARRRNNEMLQRIYGTCWGNERFESLFAYG